MEIEIYWEKPHNTYPIKKTKIYLGNFRINLLMEIGIYWEKQHNTYPIFPSRKQRFTWETIELMFCLWCVDL